MKTLIAAVIALILGFVLGGLAPRRELTQARQELDRLRRAEKPPADTPLDAFADSVLSRPAEPAIPTEAFRRMAAARAPNPPAPPSPAPAPAEPARPRRPDMAALIRLQADLWPARATLRRNQLIEKAGLNAEEAEAFDDIINQFNAALAERVARWAAFIEAHEFVNEEMRVRMLSEFSSLAADDAGTRSEFHIRDFIDPQAFLPMTSIVHQIQPRREPRR